MTIETRDEHEESEFERTRREARTIRRAWSVLAAGSVPAAESLVNLAVNARSELVRVQASTAVLDRVGIGKVEGVVVADVEGALAGEIDMGAGGGAAAILAARMRALSAAGGNVDVIRGQIVSSEAETAGVDHGEGLGAGDGTAASVDAGREPVACHACGYMPGEGDDPEWCTWCEGPIPA